MSAADALLVTLEVAVPLRMAELAEVRPEVRPRIMAAWAANAVDVLASRGDQLLFATRPQKGEGGTADTFAHLARALAAGAYVPGGVTFAGRHWCADHARCEGVQAAKAAPRGVTTVHVPGVSGDAHHNRRDGA